MKRKTWSFGPARIDVVVDMDADRKELLAPTSDEQLAERPTGTLERRGHTEWTFRVGGTSSSHSFRRWLLLVPGIVALVLWRYGDLDTTRGSVVVGVAVPTTL